EKEEEDVKITVPVEAYIPEDFIEDERERLKLYAELGRGKGSEEILSKLKELRGYLPDPLSNMFKVMKLKRIAKELGVKEITLSPSGKAIIAFGDFAEFEPEAFVNFVKEKGATFTPDRKLYIEAGDLDGLIEALEELRRKK
ncbi:MAG: TRCF domain-containing protein, partial [Desulfurobacteriaceae bacterium]